MLSRNLLLLSSSKVGNTEYLSHSKQMILDHLNGITEILFIPYAGVSISFVQYVEKVRTVMASWGINVKGLNEYNEPVNAIKAAQAIVVGGGNTFHLLSSLYQHNLIKLIQEKVNSGTPYIGWSAGSNIAGISICTTNDMPIIEPPSFSALNLINIQLNPHYTDYVAPHHNGETRDQRLAEFMILNPSTAIIGIEEGCAIKVVNDEIYLLGESNGYLFKAGNKTKLNVNENISSKL